MGAEEQFFWDDKVAQRPHLPVRNMTFFQPETKALGLECIPENVIDPFTARRMALVVHEGGKGAPRELTASDHVAAIGAALGVIGASVRGLAAIGRRRLAGYLSAKLEASRAALWGGYAVAGVVGGLVNYSLAFTFL